MTPRMSLLILGAACVPAPAVLGAELPSALFVCPPFRGYIDPSRRHNTLSRPEAG